MDHSPTLEKVFDDGSEMDIDSTSSTKWDDLLTFSASAYPARSHSHSPSDPSSQSDSSADDPQDLRRKRAYPYFHNPSGMGRSTTPSSQSAGAVVAVGTQKSIRHGRQRRLEPKRVRRSGQQHVHKRAPGSDGEYHDAVEAATPGLASIKLTLPTTTKRRHSRKNAQVASSASHGSSADDEQSSSDDQLAGSGSGDPMEVEASASEDPSIGRR